MLIQAGLAEPVVLLLKQLTAVLTGFHRHLQHQNLIRWILLMPIPDISLAIFGIHMEDYRWGQLTGTTQPSGISQTLHQIKFRDSTTGFAVGDNAIILKTTTGGNSWEIKNGSTILGQIFYSIDLMVLYF